MDQHDLVDDLPEVPNFPADDVRAVDDAELAPSPVPEVETAADIDPQLVLEQKVVRSSGRGRIFTVFAGVAACAFALQLVDETSTARGLLRRITRIHDTQATVVSAAWERAQESVATLCPSRPLPTIGHIGDSFTPPGTINEAWCLPNESAASVIARIDMILLDLHRAHDAARLMQVNRHDLSIDVARQTWLGQVIMTADEVIRGFEFMKHQVAGNCVDAGTSSVSLPSRNGRETHRQVTTPQGYRISTATPSASGVVGHTEPRAGLVPSSRQGDAQGGQSSGRIRVVSPRRNNLSISGTNNAGRSLQYDSSGPFGTLPDMGGNGWSN